MSTKAGEVWVTAKDAAAYVKVSLRTIHAACASRQLAHIRLGGGSNGEIRTTQEWIDTWLLAWKEGGQLTPKQGTEGTR